MLDPISIPIDKTDLQRDLRMMHKGDRMIDLPIFQKLKLQVEERISNYPDVIIADIQFTEPVDTGDDNRVTAVVLFKYAQP